MTRARKYTQQDLLEAYQAVREKKLTLLAACKKYDIPKQTLYDRLKGKIPIDSKKRNRKNVLSIQEEETIANSLVKLASLGFRPTRSEMQEICSVYCQLLDYPELSLTWSKKFVQRWPIVKGLRDEKITNKSDFHSKVSSWVKTFCKDWSFLVSDSELVVKPELVYFVTVLSTSDTSVPPLTLASKDVPCSSAAEELCTNRCSIIVGGSASGFCLSPYFVFERHNTAVSLEEMLQGSTDHVRGVITGTGLVTNKEFQQYVMEHFLPSIPDRTDQPIFIVLNALKSYVPTSWTPWAKENNVNFIYLPPQASQILHPFDAVCYQEVLKSYCEVYRGMLVKTKNKVSAKDICGIFCEAFHKVMTVELVKEAFKKSGIFPVDEGIVAKVSGLSFKLGEKSNSKGAGNGEQEVYDSYGEDSDGDNS